MHDFDFSHLIFGAKVTEWRRWSEETPSTHIIIIHDKCEDQHQQTLEVKVLDAHTLLAWSHVLMCYKNVIQKCVEIMSAGSSIFLIIPIVVPVFF